MLTVGICSEKPGWTVVSRNLDYSDHLGAQGTVSLAGQKTYLE